MSSAGYICKQFGPRPVKYLTSTGPKLFDTFDFPEEFFKNGDFEKMSKMTKILLTVVMGECQVLKSRLRAWWGKGVGEVIWTNK